MLAAQHSVHTPKLTHFILFLYLLRDYTEY